MFTKIKKFVALSLSIFMSFSFLSGTLVYAAENKDVEFGYETDFVTTSDDISQLKDMLSSVEYYIDLEGSKLFDEEQAIENNESQEVIEIGMAYNEMLRDEQKGQYEKVNRKKRAAIKGLTRYGNWCGKGNNGKNPIDILDAQCKIHDKCYASKGQWNSSCDVQLVRNIAKNFGKINKIGWHARTYAVAAIVLFAGKVGGTGALKVQYPLLAKFLP